MFQARTPVEVSFIILPLLSTLNIACSDSHVTLWYSYNFQTAAYSNSTNVNFMSQIKYRNGEN
jgi:hypothetical protein